MKKIVLFIAMAFTVSLIVAQSPCCKNKVAGTKCSKTAQVENGDKLADGSEVISACCKSKAEQGLSCCKNKQSTDASSCSSKKWWQLWKKGCDKPCCDKG
ncbi:MAG: hypothetical protein HOM61_08270 [Candidatus Marinimicrobia bacterium]|jgi:hypothetical protein|nr:hypothetical protein [Candidatus Neomarinimicrobiota bacterium]MBT5955997.1 hypothetical protein [Candidatus Neomarinimicrobiota bacterium]